MSIYINGIGAITIQDTLHERWPDPVSYSQPHVRCIEPPFRDWLDPMASRRMSRIIKRAAVSSEAALARAGIETPGGIITGTGLGCVEDTEKFLDAMVREGENCLQPTHFIQSTHNTISSQIAIRKQCTGYNNTHVQGGVSFESALLEASLLIGSGRADNILVGGHDEMTETYFKLLGRIGRWRDEVPDTLSIIGDKGAGTFAGEGSVSMMLGASKGAGSLACIPGISMLRHPGSPAGQLAGFLDRHGLLPQQVETVLTGENGDRANDALYADTVARVFPGKRARHYKHICGEYFTATAFAVALAAKNIGQWGNTLIYNHSGGTNHAFILIRPC